MTMKMRHILAVSAAALAIGFAAPAMAQDTEAGPGSQDMTADDNQVDDGSNNTQNEDSIDLDNLLNGSLNGSFNLTDNAADQDNDGNGSHNGNSYVVAEQSLKAININRELDEVVDLDGEDDTDTAVGYNSGNNAIRGNAFAAYAGILNQAWNTGINANTQAATNIAAQGTVNFGSDGAGAGAGDDGGD
jgi:hypothetical protein